MKPVINVVVVDDHDLVREGIVALMNNIPDIKIVASLGGGKEAIDFCSRHDVGVVLMDIKMPEMDGLTAASLILQASPTPPKVVALTFRDEQIYVETAIKAGVKGYILKCSNFLTLVEGVRAVHGGKSFFDHKVSSKIINGLIFDRQEEVSFKMSPREKEIIELIAKGYSNKEIASKLFLSPSTIDSHRRNIMKRFKAKNSVELIALAYKNGILD